MRKESVKELFEYRGTLGSFGAKIDIGYAFKLFGPKTKKDLNIIRSLRNQFAHSRMPILFTTLVVKKCCDQLTYPDAPDIRLLSSQISIDDASKILSASALAQPRNRYFLSCNEIIRRIYFIDLDGESNLKGPLL
jgi:hypothetical protein